MAAFKEMSPDLIRTALEGHIDMLSSEVQKEETFFRNSLCPVCGSKELIPYGNAAKPFTEGAVLPNKILRCLSCQTEFEPYSRFVVKTTVEIG